MARGLIRPNCLGNENTRCVTSGKVTLLGEVSPVVVSFQIGCCKFKYSCSLEIKRTAETDTQMGSEKKLLLKYLKNSPLCRSPFIIKMQVADLELY